MRKRLCLTLGQGWALVSISRRRRSRTRTPVPRWRAGAGESSLERACGVLSFRRSRIGRLDDGFGDRVAHIGAAADREFDLGWIVRLLGLAHGPCAENLEGEVLAGFRGHRDAVARWKTVPSDGRDVDRDFWQFGVRRGILTRAGGKCLAANAGKQFRRLRKRIGESWGRTKRLGNGCSCCAGEPTRAGFGGNGGKHAAAQADGGKSDADRQPGKSAVVRPGRRRCWPGRM